MKGPQIGIITGSRADWNGLGMVAKVLASNECFVNVWAIGQQAESSESLKVIDGDGFSPIRIRTNRGEDMARGAARATKRVGRLLADYPQDMVVVLGDRFEILGAATAAALRGVPIAHIGGGDITEGSVDDKLRYAITELADLHFTTNDQSAMRIGSHEPHVFTVGNPALDRIRQTPIVSRESTIQAVGMDPSSKTLILIAYHAATREADSLLACREMIEALERINASFLVLGTNSDTGSSAITEALKAFCDRTGSKMMANLPPQLFYSCLTYFDCMVGNSSAGVVETASFGIPVVNIGPRQKGRETPANVFSCDANASLIFNLVALCLRQVRPPPCANPYGDGQSAFRIAANILSYLGQR